MPKESDQPLTRRGWLKNGNPTGDFSKAARCEAKTRKGTLCKSPAMKNGRCRMHGGMSTGPKTKEGREASKKANWKHGLYSSENKKIIKELSNLIKLKTKISGGNNNG